jgi:lipid-A-disaccharide synthase
MVIAGEASGDWLAAELVKEIRNEMGTRDLPDPENLAPRFFGAGGPLMAAAGVELLFDLTRHSVIGISDVLKKYFEFRGLFQDLRTAALRRQPDIIVCVDFSGFNRRFASAIRSAAAGPDSFHNWKPKIVQYVSPQVWASREGRVRQMQRDYDLVLSIFPFEPDWYKRKAPSLNVRFVGDPMLDRYGPASVRINVTPLSQPLVLLLPGSRKAELRRHIPIIVPALAKIKSAIASARFLMVLPTEELMEQARGLGLPESVELQKEGLQKALAEADVAIASTGTVTRECAYFAVPTVALYKTSWSTFQIGKRLVKVKFLAMPNILANEAVFPEFIQHDATPQNIATAALKFLQDHDLRQRTITKLHGIAGSLGPPGATKRAARAVLALLSGW